MGKAHEHLDYYVQRASDTTEEGLSWDSPLSVDQSGKYVEILFMTGGPHFEVLIEFEDAEAATYWFENAPVGGFATYKDWGESDACLIGTFDAAHLIDGITRDPSELRDADDLQGRD